MHGVPGASTALDCSMGVKTVDALTILISLVWADYQVGTSVAGSLYT